MKVCVDARHTETENLAERLRRSILSGHARVVRETHVYQALWYRDRRRLSGNARGPAGRHAPATNPAWPA